MTGISGRQPAAAARPPVASLSLVGRMRRLFSARSPVAPRRFALLPRRRDTGPGRLDTAELFDRLLGPEAAGSRLLSAAEILRRFMASDEAGRHRFLMLLAERHDTDRDRLSAAIDAWLGDAGAAELAELHAASTPQRQHLLRALGQAPGGIATLLQMRATLLPIRRKNAALRALDDDFVQLFAAWFAGGVLELRQLDWSTSGAILSRLMRHEAVHPIESWQALRDRIEPSDRRCYGLFHPQLPDMPLIFTEVALTRGAPDSITALLATDRVPMAADKADTAAFYSISNTKRALSGIPFGESLIRRVGERLQRELPGLRQLVTLSPIPGFAGWLARQPGLLGVRERDILARPDWASDAEALALLRLPLLQAAALYLTAGQGRDMDPVARFHLGNGASVERLNWLADISAHGMRQSHGLMVNYRYETACASANLLSFRQYARVPASEAMRRLAQAASGRIRQPEHKEP